MKISRGSDSESMWLRKSAEWQEERTAVEAERSRHEQPRVSVTINAARMLELAKRTGRERNRKLAGCLGRFSADNLRVACQP
jgi:hypothetical protein